MNAQNVDDSYVISFEIHVALELNLTFFGRLYDQLCDLGLTVYRC
jgi:hypothetical protein